MNARTLTITLCCLLTCAAFGCQHNPFLVRGAMNLGGDMGMHGDIKMKGDMSLKGDNTASPLRTVTVSGNPHCGKRIAIVDVDGLLIDKNISGLNSLGENPVALFREKLRAIEKDHSIGAVVLRINSPGGGVTASDIMCHEVQRLKRRRGIPVVACIMVTGTGGAYYLASHADTVVAHPTSVVGGIGVILNHYSMDMLLENLNIFGNPIKSGDKIDAGTPERELDDEEAEMLQQMAKSFHDRFIDQVKDSRPNVADEVRLFDGSVFTGIDAEENGLIDEVGYLDDAIAEARALCDAKNDSPVVMLRRDNDRAYTALDVSPNDAVGGGLLPIKIPGLDRSSMPKFLYLWQVDPSLGGAIQ